jgi:hypothetical protein
LQEVLETALRSHVIHDLRDLRAFELHGVAADQALEIVIEIEQVEFDAPDRRS